MYIYTVSFYHLDRKGNEEPTRKNEMLLDMILEDDMQLIWVTNRPISTALTIYYLLFILNFCLFDIEFKWL